MLFIDDNTKKSSFKEIKVNNYDIKAKKAIHNIPPIYNKDSKILILGSFPSVKSREQEFYYAHKQNRFWEVLASILNCNEPETEKEKTELLLSSHIALWDVIKSCEIIGSSDTSIKNVKPNDIMMILQNSSVSRIFTNGNKAYELYKKYIFPDTKIEAIKLPSTSPANAAFSLDKLCEQWANVIKFID